VGGLSTTYLTGTLTQFVAAFTKKNSSIQVRPGLILLALIVVPTGCTVRDSRSPFRSDRAAGALGFVVAGAWTFFHRSFK